MGYVEYEKMLGDLLKSNVFFRHLFNKAKEKRPVKIKLATGDVLVGILKNVDAYFRGIELVTSKGVYYINWRHIVFIEVLENEQ